MLPRNRVVRGGRAGGGVPSFSSLARRSAVRSATLISILRGFSKVCLGPAPTMPEPDQKSGKKREHREVATSSRVIEMVWSRWGEIIIESEFSQYNGGLGQTPRTTRHGTARRKNVKIDS